METSNTEYVVLPARKKIIKSSTTTLMVVAGITMITEISLHNILISVGIIATTIAIALPKQSQYLLNHFQKFQRQQGTIFYTILLGLLSTTLVLNFAPSPASAQFFQAAQQWMTSSFATGTNSQQISTVVTLVFNVLRALFLLYVGISLVGIIQAARNDEDWQTLARTPVIIVLSVFVADIITTLIIGSGGTTTTT
jgi:hypothetical protein